MELVFFAAIGATLYVVDKFSNYLADQAAGTAFEQIHEVIGNVSYFGRSSYPIDKDHKAETLLPFLPALTHSFKVLCRTDCGHWFWFSARVYLFRVESICVKPIADQEAKKALSDNKESLEEYFPSYPDEQKGEG